MGKAYDRWIETHQAASDAERILHARFWADGQMPEDDRRWTVALREEASTALKAWLADMAITAPGRRPNEMDRAAIRRGGLR